MDRTLFIGIGPPKTGTSWLYGYLFRHPEVFMSPVKEMHHFDARYRHDKYGHWDETFRRRAADMQAKYEADPTLVRARQMAALNARVAMIDDSSAYMKYLQGAAGPQHKVIGEITPTYLFLEKDGLEAVRVASPKRRLLCTLRDPVDRLWSETRFRKRLRGPQFDMRAEFQRRLSEVPPSGWEKWITGLDRTFSAHEFRVEFYETMFTEDVMRGICEWLGVEFIAPDFSHRPNRSEAAELPPDLNARGRLHFAPLYAYCEQRFGERLPARWLLPSATTQSL